MSPRRRRRGATRAPGEGRSPLPASRLGRRASALRACAAWVAAIRGGRAGRTPESEVGLAEGHRPGRRKRAARSPATSPSPSASREEGSSGEGSSGRPAGLGLGRWRRAPSPLRRRTGSSLPTDRRKRRARKEKGREHGSSTSGESLASASNTAYWEGYAQAVAQFFRDRRRRARDGASASMSSSTAGRSDSQGPGRKHQRQKRKGRKRRRLSSGQSSSWEEGQSDIPDGWYWLEGAYIPGLPSWVKERRAEAVRLLDEAGVEEWRREPPGSFRDGEAPPGVHLSAELRERALDGYFVDVFDFAQGRVKGDTGKRKDKDRRVVQRPERTMVNWIKGYSEYQALISAAYPERGWHLTRHFSHVIEAWETAGEEAALEYDREFRELASRSASTRWDLKLHDAWSTQVDPSVGHRKDKRRESAKGLVRKSLGD